MAAAHEDGGAEPEPAPRDAAGEVWQLQQRTFHRSSPLILTDQHYRHIQQHLEDSDRQ